MQVSSQPPCLWSESSPRRRGRLLRRGPLPLLTKAPGEITKPRGLKRILLGFFFRAVIGSLGTRRPRWSWLQFAIKVSLSVKRGRNLVDVGRTRRFVSDGVTRG